MKTAKENNQKSKRFKKIVPLALLVLLSVVTLIGVLPLLPKRPQSLPQKHYSGVVELWNVETFEGGSGSRASWLTARAAKFERMHEGLFVHVSTLNVQQLKEKLDNGENFDVVCFSRGVGNIVQNLLQPYKGSVADIRENLLISGEVGNSVLGLPLYAGSYCLFARESQISANSDLIATALSNTYTRKVGKNSYSLQPLICGFTQYNSPLSALAMSGAHGSVLPNEATTQYAAYESFVANKTAVTLLGTQRDLYRLGKKEEAGKVEKLAFAPLCGYTDLVQYLGISNTCGEKTDCCTEFLQYLVEKQSQETLVNVNMFSVLEETFYTSERWLACERGLNQAYVPNVFGSEEALAAQRLAAISTLGM